MNNAVERILTLTCRDRTGIVAGVTGALAAESAFILDSQQYADLTTDRFFMRVVFRDGNERSLRLRLDDVGRALALDWQLAERSQRPRVLIAVSKASHCLVDLLHRWRTGVLPVEVVGVVSNHEQLSTVAGWHDVPFHHLPIGNDRGVQETAMLSVLEREACDYLVLARYMQVLSPNFIRQVTDRCINIHHSFLPSFQGARPYERAHAHGVKLIGATAHFVTAELDEGPIIEQAVERVDHRSEAADLARIGRDIEARVLARAVAWVAERRVFISGRRTVVFR